MNHVEGIVDGLVCEVLLYEQCMKTDLQGEKFMSTIVAVLVDSRVNEPDLAALELSQPSSLLSQVKSIVHLRAFEELTEDHLSFICV